MEIHDTINQARKETDALAPSAHGINDTIEKVKVESDSLAPATASVADTIEQVKEDSGIGAGIPLTEEQRKRIDLLDEYEKEIDPVRAERNAALAAHEAEWKKKWVELNGTLDQARADAMSRLEKDGVAEHLRDGIVAKEVAALAEQHQAEKDQAARKLDVVLPRHKKWSEWLEEKAKEHPDDPTLASMLEEAKNAPDPAIDGMLRVPTPKIVLQDLVHSVNEKTGVIDYRRGMFTAIRDVGARLDVMKTDDRDIEAAMKIAAQKFDVDKKLTLTGDLAFKVKAAEIAGRMGIELKNQEPEVVRAWAKGKQQQQEKAMAMKSPGVSRSIEGDLLPRGNTPAFSGNAELRADPIAIANADKLRITPIGVNDEELVQMSAQRMLAANAAIREMPIPVLSALARSDLSKPDGGHDADTKALLAKEGLVDEKGDLTPEALDVVLVRDATVLEKRAGMETELEPSFGKLYKTSGDFIREAAQSQEQGQQKQEEKAMEQKSLNARNIDEQEEKRVQKIEEKKIERRARHRQPEVELER